MRFDLKIEKLKARITEAGVKECTHYKIHSDSLVVSSKTSFYQMYYQFFKNGIEDPLIESSITHKDHKEKKIIDEILKASGLIEKEAFNTKFETLDRKLLSAKDLKCTQYAVGMSKNQAGYKLMVISFFSNDIKAESQTTTVQDISEYIKIKQRLKAPGNGMVEKEQFHLHLFEFNSKGNNFQGFQQKIKPLIASGIGNFEVGDIKNGDATIAFSDGTIQYNITFENTKESLSVNELKEYLENLGFENKIFRKNFLKMLETDNKQGRIKE